MFLQDIPYIKFQVQKNSHAMISIMCNYDQLLQNCKISQLRQTTAVSYRKEKKEKMDN